MIAVLRQQGEGLVQQLDGCTQRSKLALYTTEISSNR